MAEEVRRDVIVTNTGRQSNSGLIAVLVIGIIAVVGAIVFFATNDGDGDIIPDEVNVNIDDDSGSSDSGSSDSGGSDAGSGESSDG